MNNRNSHKHHLPYNNSSAYHIYSFVAGELVENPRDLFAIAENENDTLDTAIENLFLVGGTSRRRVVFVRSVGQAAPLHAYKREADGNEESQRYLKFCGQCPHRDYCGMNFGCGLSENGDPQHAFRVFSIPAATDSVALIGLQSMLDSQKLGQIWLNDINTVYELLHALESATLTVWARWWKRELTEGEAMLLEKLHLEWNERIFRGMNPRYAVLEWNRDPNGLNRYIVEKYYVEENEYDLEDCPQENAVEGILDCCSATARFAIRELASDERPYSEEELTRIWEEIAADAIYHTPFMLGIPGQIKLSDIKANVMEGDE